MQIDAALVGVLVTVLLAILGITFGYGVLTNKVSNNRKDINDIWDWLQNYQKENKSDHNQINSKLDNIIRNGARREQP